MIRLVESPEVIFSRERRLVYAPVPPMGASDEEYRQWVENWGRPVDVAPSGIARLSVRLTIEFDRESGPTVDALQKALRAVLLETMGKD